MRLQIVPGSYVIAVSGGIDSMALLHMVKERYGGSDKHHFVVAHFDHGIRPDSPLDRALVQKTSVSYGLQFEFAEGNLGAGASEETARNARYMFLERVRQTVSARAIIMAHHQDDVLETALLNVLRGTNRRGLSSLRSTCMVIRPLLGMSKVDLRTYATTHKLSWREDSTNADPRYKRNYVRHQVLARASQDERYRLLELVNRARVVNDSLDIALAEYLAQHHPGGDIERAKFAQLPHVVAREVMAFWLRGKGIIDYDSRGLDRLVIAAKTLVPGTKTNVTKRCFLAVGRNNLALECPDR